MDNNDPNKVLNGIKWVHDNSNSHIILEMDNQIAVNMIKGLTPAPWTPRKTMSKIQRKIQNMNCEIIYCFREANCVADALARHATTRDMDYIFSKEENMFASTVRPMRMDRLNLASFRFKKKKNTWDGTMNHLEC